MRALKSITLNEQQPLQGQVRILDLNIQRLFTILNGRVRWGTVTDNTASENMDAEWQTFTSHATPDTEFSVAHTIGAIPQGYVVVSLDKAGVLYIGSTAWDSTTLYFKCNVASVAFKILVLR